MTLMRAMTIERMGGGREATKLLIYRILNAEITRSL